MSIEIFDELDYILEIRDLRMEDYEGENEDEDLTNQEARYVKDTLMVQIRTGYPLSRKDKKLFFKTVFSEMMIRHEARFSDVCEFNSNRNDLLNEVNDELIKTELEGWNRTVEFMTENKIDNPENWKIMTIQEVKIKYQER